MSHATTAFPKLINLQSILEGARRRGRQRKCRWTTSIVLPMSELLAVASRRKDSNRPSFPSQSLTPTTQSVKVPKELNINLLRCLYTYRCFDMHKRSSYVGVSCCDASVFTDSDTHDRKEITIVVSCFIVSITFDYLTHRTIRNRVSCCDVSVSTDSLTPMTVKKW